MKYKLPIIARRKRCSRRGRCGLPDCRRRHHYTANGAQKVAVAAGFAMVAWPQRS
jgi:hypothetical protein